MYYNEFKDSSLRHFETCKCLIENLNSCEKKKKHILSNIYYLSGYILETIFKYEIFRSMGYKQNKNIEALDQDGLKFKDIKIHKLSALKSTLESKSPYRLEDYDENKIQFEAWEHQIRYRKSKDTIDETEVINFFEFSKKNFDNIRFRKRR
jgi:hypothetical protein